MENASLNELHNVISDGKKMMRQKLTKKNGFRFKWQNIVSRHAENNRVYSIGLVSIWENISCKIDAYFATIQFA